MNKLQQLAESKEKEYSVLVEQLKEQEGIMAKLHADHTGAASDIEKAEDAGLMDKFKKALRRKKDLSTEISDTEETIAYIQGKIDKRKQDEGNAAFNKFQKSLQEDLDAGRESIQPKISQIKEHIESALALYEEINAEELALKEESRREGARVAKYLPRDKASLVSQLVANGSFYQSYKHNELQTFKNKSFE